ncbi:MAG: prenyltransferase/squalene oxidase repeat-containing protein [Brevefilum sp.]
MKIQVKKILFSLLIAAVLSLTVSPLTMLAVAQTMVPTSEIEVGISKAINYLQTQQNDDGGIRWFDDTSSVSATIRVVLALTASGYPQDKLISQQNLTLIDFITAHGYEWIYQSDAEEPTLNVARAGQLLMAVAAADQNPHAFGPEAINLPHLLKNQFDTNTGMFGNASPNNVTDQVWAMLGLAAAYAGVPQEAAAWLASVQLEDGSWDDGFGSYLDTTPLALMALLASGHTNEGNTEIQLALSFIRENQNPSGGWQTDWDTTTNANTTGMLLQSIYAAGQNPDEQGWTTEGGSPLSALLGLQQEDGAIGGDFINAFGTADAILGLSGHPFYDLSRLRQVGRAFEYIFALQAGDGGWGNVGQTLDVIITTHAAGWDPITISRNGQSPLTYLADQLGPYLENGPDAIGKTILSLAAAGQDPAHFQGIDLVSALMITYNPDNNAFGIPENTWHQALAILGLAAAQAEIPQGAIQTLLDLQDDDGGWEYSTGFGASPDSTALALQALFAAGVQADQDPIQAGLSYIRSQQLESGGWGDSNTTAFVLMALNALGVQPEDWHTESGKNPIQELLTYQTASGAFMFSEDYPDDNLMATAAAVLALTGGHYRIQPVEQDMLNAAGLVIHTDQTETTTACVRFEGDSISGLVLIDESGIAYQMQDGFMNSILGISNPQGGTLYWSYWQWDGREWVFNNTGAGDSRVLPGDIEAWFLTNWEMFPSPPPAYVPHLSSICGDNQLKNYASQPFLNYYDLFQPPLGLSQIEISQGEQVTTEDIVESVEPTPVETQPEVESVQVVTTPEAEDLPLTPIIIIAVVALIVLAVIIWLTVRKK